MSHKYGILSGNFKGNKCTNRAKKGYGLLLVKETDATASLHLVKR